MILATAEIIKAGEKDFNKVKQQAVEQLLKKGFKIDYFDICNTNDLEDAHDKDRLLLIAAAAWMGQPRLLDNLEVSLTL